MLNDAIQSVTGANRRQQLAQGPRRHYSLDFKIKVVKETLAPGASVAAVALRHNINTNVVFRWRKEYRQGQLGENTAAAFVPVRVVQDAPAVAALPAPQTSTPAVASAAKPSRQALAGLIEFDVPGGFVVRVDENVDDRALRRVLRAMRDLA
jgi:transposase